MAAARRTLGASSRNAARARCRSGFGQRRAVGQHLLFGQAKGDLPDLGVQIAAGVDQPRRAGSRARRDSGRSAPESAARVRRPTRAASSKAKISGSPGSPARRSRRARRAPSRAPAAARCARRRAAPRATLWRRHRPGPAPRPRERADPRRCRALHTGRASARGRASVSVRRTRSRKRRNASLVLGVPEVAQRRFERPRQRANAEHRGELSSKERASRPLSRRRRRRRRRRAAARSRRAPAAPPPTSRLRRHQSPTTPASAGPASEPMQTSFERVAVGRGLRRNRAHLGAAVDARPRPRIELAAGARQR